MKEITPEELKTLQLDVLQAVDKFCRERGIRYSLACGSMLGAVRHKGYIPWDDDLDVYLLREDYNRLMAEFPAVYEGRYELVSLERDDRWDLLIAQAYDNRTVFVEGAHTAMNVGVKVDLFPIDDVPDDEAAWTAYDRKRRLLARTLLVKSSLISRKQRSFRKNLGMLLVKIVSFPIGRKRLGRILNRYAQKFNGKGYHSAFECIQGLLQKHKFSKALFDSLVDYPFEDRHFLGFADADAYLRNGYGDYMKLPPEEKRVAHHLYKAYWK